MGVQVFWGLDKKLAQRKHFPSLNWLTSYTKYESTLVPFFNTIQPGYKNFRATARQILQIEDNLQETVQLVGKDSLSEDQKVVMEVAKILREDFLQQNAFTQYDFTCKIYKSVGMMRVIVHFYKSALRALKDSAAQKEKLNWSTIKTALGPLIEKITSMKFEDPMKKESYFKAFFDNLIVEIDDGFSSLVE